MLSANFFNDLLFPNFLSLTVKGLFSPTNLKEFKDSNVYNDFGILSYSFLYHSTQPLLLFLLLTSLLLFLFGIFKFLGEKKGSWKF